MLKPLNKRMLQGVSLLLVAVFSMFLRISIPPNIILGTSYDDWLQVHLASNILAGNWLGPWEIRTLIKGPGYPIFLATTNFLKISPIYALHFLYLVACLFALQFLMRLWPTLFNSFYSRSFTYLLLAFNPVVFSSDFSRIYRNGLFAVLIFFGVTCGLDAILLAKDRLKSKRNKYQFEGRLFLASLILGFSMITRVDGSLIYPILILVIIFTIIAEWFSTNKIKYTKKGKKVKSKSIKGIVPALPIIATAIVLYFLPTLLIQTLNNNYYGINSVDDYSKGNFAAAMKTWESLMPRSDDRLYIPVTKSQKEIAFQVSPKARMLENYLKDEKTWEKETSCQQNVDCESSGPWFVFEVRDAVVNLGIATNPQDFQNFFGGLNSELKGACAAGRISCGPDGLGTGIQPPSQFKINMISSRVFEQLKDLGGYRFNYNYTLPASIPDLNKSIGPEWRSVIVLDESIWQNISYSEHGIMIAKKASTGYKILAILSLVSTLFLAIILPFRRLIFKKYKYPFIVISTLTLAMLQILLVVGIATLSFLPSGYDKGYILSIQPLSLLFQIMVIGFAFKTIQDKLELWGNRNVKI